MKVTTAQTTSVAQATPTSTPASVAEGPTQNRLGAALWITTLAMLAIALRRGGR
jgi:hypothetical protein